ncbi:uncharacterized protein Hap1MRO34_011989 [Clarias gariepinus]|uniref:uncharacterized protein LOC128531453 n=1 Tax=Clarias gariepinus TaxID=13013 RepID=UPI00234DBD11|nr:uncharacterized protein LOC128531453 [Clarias gariepinus]
MINFWILIVSFSTIYTVQAVDQPDKELSVDIGSSATLRCCISENEVGIIAWFKQPNRQKPRIMVEIYKSAGETFYDGFQKSDFKIERFLNCFNMTILKTTQSDEAMYYCALMEINPVFADGTYLKIKDVHATTASETSVPDLCDSSVMFKPTLHGNSTNMKTVLGLGTALGVCALLIFCLIYFVLRRKNIENSRVNAYVKHPGTRQESESETLNYAAVQFTKTKAKAERRKDGSSDNCVTEVIYNTIR